MLSRRVSLISFTNGSSIEMSWRIAIRATNERPRIPHDASMTLRVFSWYPRQTRVRTRRLTLSPGVHLTRVFWSRYRRVSASISANRRVPLRSSTGRIFSDQFQMIIARRSHIFFLSFWFNDKFTAVGNDCARPLVIGRSVHWSRVPCFRFVFLSKKREPPF